MRRLTRRLSRLLARLQRTLNRWSWFLDTAYCCRTCEYVSGGRHRSVEECAAVRGGVCPDPSEHHEFVRKHWWAR